jgi:hypothetical protein
MPKTIAPYDEYRRWVSGYLGMSMGATPDADTYERILGDPVSRFKVIAVDGAGRRVPLAASNGTLGYFDPLDVPEEALVVILPESALDTADTRGLGSQGLPVLMPRQRILSEDLVGRYMSKMRSVPASQLEDFLSDDGSIALMPKVGLAEFVGVSRYDIAGCDDLRNEPVPDEILTDSTLLTTSVDYISERLPELVKLHTDIFGQQATEIGYYDGLDEEEISALLVSGDFTPVAAFDRGSGEATAFAFFARDLTQGMERLAWLNAERAQEVVAGMSQAEDHILSLPYHVVSKGGGMLPLITKIAGKATVFGTTATELFTLTSTSSASINYAPALFNRALETIGFKYLNSTFQATFLTRVSETQA